MFSSINNYGGYNRQVRQNPDDYAKTYAQQNGLSIEDAKAELKAQYGDPVKDASGSVFNFNSQSDVTNTDFSEIFDSPMPKKGSVENLITSILNSIMNFLNGNNKTNNLKGAGELEATKIGDGPQKEGDPQLHLNNNSGAEGPQKEGDPQPHLNNNQTGYTIPVEILTKPIEIEKPSGSEELSVPQEPSAPEAPSVPEEPQKPSAPEERPVVEGKEKPEEPSAPAEPKEPEEPSAPEERPVVEGKEKPKKPEKPSRPPRQ